MASIGDVTLVFETVGEDAASRGSDKVAGSVDKIRTKWSQGLEQLGKVQSRIALISSGLAAFGLGGITSESFKQKNLQRNAIGDAITGGAELILTGGGALLGSLAGAVIPVVGPIIGSIAGGIIGGLLTSVLEPWFQALGEALKSFDTRVREALAEEKTQIGAAIRAQQELQKEITTVLREQQREWDIFRRSENFREMTREDIDSAIDDSLNNLQDRLSELSEAIRPTVQAEIERLRRRAREVIVSPTSVVRDRQASETLLSQTRREMATIRDRARVRTEEIREQADEDFGMDNIFENLPYFERRRRIEEEYRNLLESQRRQELRRRELSDDTTVPFVEGARGMREGLERVVEESEKLWFRATRN